MSTPENGLSFTPPSPELNPLTVPLGYFDAQVQFAQKWSEISGKDFAETLLRKTTLYRQLFDKPVPEDNVPDEWKELLTIEANASSTSPDNLAQSLFATYSQQPWSLYAAPEHAGAFGYDYYPERRAVKIHFTNPKRGERPLSDDHIAERRAEIQALLVDVQTKHPEAAMLISATWLRSTRSYRSLSPPDIAAQQNLMSPNMKLTGNSVWGQFIDAAGNLNQRVYEQFIAGIAAATTVDELLDALPYKTLKAEDPIQKYYDFYSVQLQ